MIRLSELLNNNKETKKLRTKKLLEGWKDIEEIFYYQRLLYVPKIICFKLISKYYNNLLVGYFGIEKTRELII